MAGRRVYGGGDDGGSISGVSSNHSVLLQNRGGSFASEPLSALFLSGSSPSTSPSLLGTPFFLIFSVLASVCLISLMFLCGIDAFSHPLGLCAEFSMLLAV